MSERITITAFGLTDKGQIRENNEDAFVIAHIAQASEGLAPDQVVTLEAHQHAVLLGVSDGMGGASAGEVASALVVESLQRALQDAQGDWDAATRKAVESANHAVWDASRAPGRKGMGATLTAVCIYGTQAHIAEVGDSRAYLIRGARIRQMTRDQSFVQLLVEAGALRKEEATTYPMKNVVLQVMGQKPDVQTALGRLELRRGDHLILCSDGLSGMVSDEEIRDVVIQSLTIDRACEDLVTLANQRGGLDNITVVIAALSGEGLELPRAEESMTQTFHVLAEYRPAAPSSSKELPGLGGDDDEDSWGGGPAKAKSLPPMAPAKAMAAGARGAAPAKVSSKSAAGSKTAGATRSPARELGAAPTAGGTSPLMRVLGVVALAGLLALAVWLLVILIKH